jgi:hypothetical protein
MSESSSEKGHSSKISIIRSAFIKICADNTFQRRLWNKQLPAEIWVETLMSSIKVGIFNAAMGSRGDFDGQMMSQHDGTNTTGIFRRIFQRTLFYIVTNKNKQVPYPSPLGKV